MWVAASYFVKNDNWGLYNLVAGKQQSDGEFPNYNAVSIAVSVHSYQSINPKLFVCMQSYRQQSAYIIAEGPTQSTAKNMWELIDDRECDTVVMLSDITEAEKVWLDGLNPNVLSPPLLLAVLAQC